MTNTPSSAAPADEVTPIPTSLRGPFLSMRWVLDAPCASVWSALVDPTRLRVWAPYVPERDLGEPGPIISAPDDASGPADLSVTDVLEGFRLGMHWGPERIDWQLAPDGERTQLQLTQTLADPAGFAEMAAGWQLAVERLDAHLTGRRTAVPAGDASQRVQALAERYRTLVHDTNADDWDELQHTDSAPSGGPVSWVRVTG